MIRTILLYALAFGIFANLADCHSSNASVHHKQHFKSSFESRSQTGAISITVQPNDDQQHAFGLDLIYPGVPLTQFFGFPVVHGTITYPIPSSPFSGYGSLFGWIQFIKQDTDGEAGNWTMDAYPFAQDLQTPFAYFGYNPSTLDAPATYPYVNGTTVAWTAQAYLTVLADAGFTKNVTVVPGGAFTWGFDINIDENSPLDRQIVVRRIEKIDVDSEWGERLPLLRETFTEWTFQDADVVV